MALEDKPTLEEIPANPDERVKILLRFIDEALESDMARENIDRAMNQVFRDERKDWILISQFAFCNSGYCGYLGLNYLSLNNWK